MSDGLLDIYSELQRSMSQFIHFVLGAAGGGIAFAVHQTSGEPFSPAMIPIGAAVIFWAISFFSGLVALQRRQSFLTLNFNIIQFKKNAYEQLPEAHIYLTEEFERGKTDLKSAAAKPLFWMTWQRWNLFVGALAYLAGHIWQMSLVK
ncbi:hypothetical protein U8326_02250 [Tsuneonella sp. CC-YZS046]|uniref:hypothetical protein n=1 Tax=Tsuneonella sp. CC-YZS046 TaxID=3042152 RepID=UPI002D78A838|nr:hypothetical protein [Tsuneonella sp. CC-YZS046]WRO67015.1 hypothetical protein U8326_02250 [Tsuneonella sp. CC-YZS046]